MARPKRVERMEVRMRYSVERRVMGRKAGAEVAEGEPGLRMGVMVPSVKPWGE
jgi:hypothetical protein